MGMSSSQARLLSLTARMHDIEYKAQRIEAQKLQLANDSSRVYEDYIRVLDAKKIQYKALTTQGAVTYRDANMNIMQNGVIGGYTGEKSLEVLFLQNKDGRIMVTPTVANHYGLTATGSGQTDMDTYIHDVTGKNKKEIPVYRTEYEQDTSVIASYSPVANTLMSNPSAHNEHTYAPVANSIGGIDYDALKTYAEFNTSHNSPISEATALSGTSSITAGGNYTISSVSELQKLLSEGNATNTAGTTFTLTTDLDLSGINWTGIQNFAGIFDGNGYVISNLNGTQGLFASTQNATIKNVGLENVNVNTSSENVGGLIGNAANTSVSNSYTTGKVKGGNNTGGLIGNQTIGANNVITMNKVYSSATATGGDKVGGLIGQTKTSPRGQFDLTNCYAIGNVKGSDSVGGLIGYSYNDQDVSHFTERDVTDIVNAYAGGDVQGTSNVGGFVGTYLFWGDYGDTCEIKKCQSSGHVSGSSNVGAFAGHLLVKMSSASLDPSSEHYVDNYLIKFVDCGYSSISGASAAYGSITDADGTTTSVTIDGTVINIPDRVQSSGASSGLVEFQMAGSVPSIAADGSGAYMSNILGVFTKAGLFDACDDSPETTLSINYMKSKIANFFSKFSNNTEDNTKLWYLNNAICSYLNTGANPELAQALYNDVVHGTTTETAGYQSGAALSGSVKRGAGTEWTTDGNHDLISGQLSIPSINTIADEIYYAMKKEGYTTTQATVRSWFNSQYGSLDQTSKITLANINDMINNGSNLTPIFNAIPAGTYSNNTKYDNPENPWTINVSSSDQTISYTYGTKPVSVYDHSDYEWDMTDPDIVNAVAMWGMSQRGIIIVDEAQASDYKYLVNVLEAGEAVLTTFDPSKGNIFTTMSAQEIANMPDEEYNKLMNIVNTSVAVNTSVQEVSDEKELKKAEAKYEADMKKIDMKDRKYDAELAKFETERSAVKEEMDTLKNVAKDNVERTFKLFS